MKYWRGRTGTAKEGQFGTMDNGQVPDADECTKGEYDSYAASKGQAYVEPIRRDLKSVSNIQKLRADSISKINRINSNNFPTEDIIPAIKEIAETQKAILEMILNL